MAQYAWSELETLYQVRPSNALSSARSLFWCLDVFGTLAVQCESVDFEAALALG